ncbi:hypothetical protein VMT65_12400 [Nocardia sp. CDC153]|uniref:hypothetical protein n=1 Tax=Nocardia sp. CDC153 TaxID=3112167 RepID=UPI002DC019B0|nr:hypothetical protein [Nocardia sp. CDC153]MEC3953832.1 hypothetical protein [Nocardia sp. CDC153]
MSTTESDSRTTEPVTPAPDGAYTGTWSDWITGTPARPTNPEEYDDYYDDYYEDGAYHRARENYEPIEYDEDDLDEDDYPGPARHSHWDNRPHPAGRHAHQPDDPHSADDGPQRHSIDSRSSEPDLDNRYGPGIRPDDSEPRRDSADDYESGSDSQWGGGYESDQHTGDSAIRSQSAGGNVAGEGEAVRAAGIPPRGRRYRSPRALSAYDVLRERASFDPAGQSKRGDRLDPPPGYPTERRPLKRAPKPTPARERLGLSLDLGGRQWAVPLLGLLAVLAVTAAIAVQIAKVTGDNTPAKPHVATPQAAAPQTPTATAPPTASGFAQPAAGPADLCPNETKGDTVRGNGPGSTKSGPDVILALQNRYYVDRSGKSVREMFAPDAAAPTVDQIQAGIDSIPVGTTYCVQIMPGPFDGQHVMIVTERHPDTTTRTWSPQLVITTKQGDATLISAIVPLNEDTPK